MKMLPGFAGFLLCVMLSHVEAKEAKMKPFAFPAAQYADFALSKDARTWDAKHPINKKALEDGDGQPLNVLRENKTEKWVQVYAASCQNTLKMPFGWFGLDDGSTTYFWTPDEKTRIICAFNSLEDSKPPANTTLWAHFKNGALAQMRKQMPKARFRQFSLKDGSFGIEARGIRSESGREVSFLQIWKHNPQLPAFALSLSLTSPAASYEHNLGLIGLMLRDRKVQWTH